ncbi:MAG: hypothetical protein ACR2PF_16025 [Rhizobiaceae bacterium]
MTDLKHNKALLSHLLCLLWLVLLLTSARADWINLTGAETSPNIVEITVLEDRVSIRLEAFVGDLESFQDLIPNSMMKDDGKNRPPLIERMARFSREGLKVLDPDGNVLPAKLVLAEPRMRTDRKSPFAGFINPQTRQPVPEPPADKRVLYVELEYAFKGQPETLTFSPPQDEDGNANLGIGFIAYHKSVPIIDFRYLGGNALLTLDWQDPWYSKFANRNLKRHHKSAMMSFLYVEPREVRHEMLLRVRDLEEWTDLGITEAEMITNEDQAHAKEMAQKFLAQRNQLTVDGVQVQPSTSRAEFLKISLAGLQVIEDNEALDRSTAIIGVILSYNVRHLPKEVTVKWDLFNSRIQRIPTTSTDPAGPFKTFIDADNPVLEWKNFLLKYSEPEVTPVTLDSGQTVAVSFLSLLLLTCGFASAGLAMRLKRLSRLQWVAASAMCFAGAFLAMRIGVVDVKNPFPGAPDEETSGRIVTEVLNNVNNAFLERDPAELKRALAVIVEKDVLADVEVELGRALAIKVAGGGIAQVAAIENLKLQQISSLQDRQGFSSLAEWTARAQAGHWGHPHRRTIKFRALMEVARIDGAWKLVGMTVVDAKQQS